MNISDEAESDKGEDLVEDDECVVESKHDEECSQHDRQVGDP